MSRKRLSEFRAKSILYASLGLPYDGVEVDREKEDWPTNLPAKAGPYVVKVDQAVKGRFKKGLVRLNRSSKQLADDVREISAKGYRFLLIEPYRTHTPEDERYLSLQLTRDGIVLTSSVRGGVEVESHTDSLQSALYAPGMSLDTLGIPADALTHIVESFTENYFSFLEINPLVVTESEILLLDAAVEVDEEGEFFENNWTETDFRRLTSRKLAPQENAVIELAAQSQASFTLEVINPMGSVFLLLSGGGASVIVADEVYNQGKGDLLANYGEYSGNPNAEETQTYTNQILELLLVSPAPRKALIIAGGVANFTDIRATFSGVLKALKQHEAELRKQSVAVFVRRGGPHEAEGLTIMREYLAKAGIQHEVSGPELPLTEVAKQAVAFIGSKK
jgi:ATP citrate (pro-S)-lyase